MHLFSSRSETTRQKSTLQAFFNKINHLATHPTRLPPWLFPASPLQRPALALASCILHCSQALTVDLRVPSRDLDLDSRDLDLDDIAYHERMRNGKLTVTCHDTSMNVSLTNALAFAFTLSKVHRGNVQIMRVPSRLGCADGQNKCLRIYLRPGSR